MRTTRLLLLTGTILPALVLGDLSAAARGLSEAGPLVVAQAGPGGERGEPRGDGPRGGPPGVAPRPERDAPEPRQPRAAQTPAERPEPRGERPEPRGERRPEPREAAPERPAARPEAPVRPAPRQERPAEPQGSPEPGRRGRDPDAAPAEQRRDRDRGGQERRDQERRPDQPVPPGREPGPDRGRRAPDAPAPQTQPEAPRPRSPDAVQPPRPNAVPGVPGRPVAPPDADRQGIQPPPAPSAAPGVPGRPATPTDGQNEPRSRAPNAAPGIPGRPVAPPDAPGGQPPNVQGAPAPSTAPGIPGRPPAPPQGTPQDGARQDGRRLGDPTDRGDRRDGFNTPGRPGYVQGGFRGDDDARSYDDVRRDRREFNEDGRTFIREPGRIIVRDRDRTFIRHDENERFRDLDRRGFRSERRGQDTVTYLDRPGGEQIVTIVDDDGRLLRRSRRFRDGREVIIIDNAVVGPRRPIYDDVVDLPPPVLRIPRERYVVDYEGADERTLYETLSAPPVEAVSRRYTLDQVRYSPQLRARMRSVDIDTITFETGSFTVTPDQAARLSTMAAAINQAIRANPQEVFLIEGYTDAVGADVDNLSLSDRRAQSVATVLTQSFQVPPENLTTQGYGEQNLKVNTQGPSRENRRVTVRRITPLIQQQGEAAPPPR